jgi:hypothetical protein
MTELRPREAMAVGRMVLERHIPVSELIGELNGLPELHAADNAASVHHAARWSMN